jgi:hypothetical protein
MALASLEHVVHVMITRQLVGFFDTAGVSGRGTAAFQRMLQQVEAD